VTEFAKADNVWTPWIIDFDCTLVEFGRNSTISIVLVTKDPWKRFFLDVYTKKHKSDPKLSKLLTETNGFGDEPWFLTRMSAELNKPDRNLLLKKNSCQWKIAIRNLTARWHYLSQIKAGCIFLFGWTKLIPGMGVAILQVTRVGSSFHKNGARPFRQLAIVSSASSVNYSKKTQGHSSLCSSKWVPILHSSPRHSHRTILWGLTRNKMTKWRSTIKTNENSLSSSPVSLCRCCLLNNKNLFEFELEESLFLIDRHGGNETLELTNRGDDSIDAQTDRKLVKFQCPHCNVKTVTLKVRILCCMLAKMKQAWTIQD